METGAHDLSTLFRQLGLAGETVHIDGFLATHSLPAGQTLAEAPYWSPSQAALLSEAISSDAEWAEAADELAARLSGNGAQMHGAGHINTGAEKLTGVR
jgi:hypothetical protein